MANDIKYIAYDSGITFAYNPQGCFTGTDTQNTWLVSQHHSFNLNHEMDWSYQFVILKSTRNCEMANVY